MLHELTEIKRAQAAVRLGRNIRAARVKAGYSREKLSELSGLSTNYIGIIERGMKNITIINCQRLAGALSTSIDNLLEGVFPSANEARNNKCPSTCILFNKAGECELKEQ